MSQTRLYSKSRKGSAERPVSLVVSDVIFNLGAGRCCLVHDRSHTRDSPSLRDVKMDAEQADVTSASVQAAPVSHQKQVA